MKNLLYLCDLRKFVWNVGDLLQMQMDSMISRWKYKANKIDMVWLYMPQNPAPGRGINEENGYYFLSRILPLAYINPYLESFSLLCSIEDLKFRVETNRDSHHVVIPTEEAIHSKRFIGAYGKVISFYKRCGFIPHLSCRPSMFLWAHAFLKIQEINYPIVVHLRKDPCGHRPQSDSDFDAWLGFFRHCRSKYKKKFKFVIVGIREEIDSRFREIGNVLFSKDYGTTVEQDLALIQASLMFIGCSSGPESMAIYGEMPYLIFDPFIFGKDKKGYECIERGRQYPFASSFQRLVWESATRDVIKGEFERLIDEVDISQWKQKYDKVDIMKLKKSRSVKIPGGGKGRGSAYIL